MHSTQQKGQWSFSQIYIITRREEFSISGEFLYRYIIIYTYTCASRYITYYYHYYSRATEFRQINILSHIYTPTRLHVDTSLHTTLIREKYPFTTTHYICVYIVILYKIRNTIIIKGHGDECIIEWLLCSNAPGFFFLFYYYSTATGSNRVRTDVRRS
jgi:hypothetical protein